MKRTHPTASRRAPWIAVPAVLLLLACDPGFPPAPAEPEAPSYRLDPDPILTGTTNDKDPGLSIRRPGGGRRPDPTTPAPFPGRVSPTQPQIAPPAPGQPPGEEDPTHPPGWGSDRDRCQAAADQGGATWETYCRSLIPALQADCQQATSRDASYRRSLCSFWWGP